MTSRRRRRPAAAVKSLEIYRSDDHRYFIGDNALTRREVPGVTRVLHENNFINDEFYTDESRTRGQLIHAIMEDIARRRVFRFDLPEHLAGWVASLRRYFEEKQPKVNGVEVIMADDVYGFAGTCDLDMRVEGDDAIGDVKAGVPEPWHGLQLAAYAYLRYGAAWRVKKRFGIYLNDDGRRPRVIPYDDPEDFETFKRALANTYWRIKHGRFDRPYGRRDRRRIYEPAVDDRADSIDFDHRIR